MKFHILSINFDLSPHGFLFLFLMYPYWVDYFFSVNIQLELLYFQKTYIGLGSIPVQDGGFPSNSDGKESACSNPG